MNAQLIRPAPLMRRLWAALYDSLLIIALWFFVGFAALPFTGGQAVSVANPWFATAVYGLSALFFVFFWTRGGQTLGMRAWRLQLRRSGGGRLSPARALWRLSLAIPCWLCGGLGIWAMLLDPQRRTLHDRWSGTEVILAPAPQRPQSTVPTP